MHYMSFVHIHHTKNGISKYLEKPIKFQRSFLILNNLIQIILCLIHQQIQNINRWFIIFTLNTL